MRSGYIAERGPAKDEQEKIDCGVVQGPYRNLTCWGIMSLMSLGRRKKSRTIATGDQPHWLGTYTVL